MNLKVKNALISVSNKENLDSLLKILKKFNITIISSGGTYTAIKKLGYRCIELSKYTGFKEMLDGRVKTLHPKIHAGILHDRQNKKHKSEMSKQNFPPIDLIVDLCLILISFVNISIRLNSPISFNFVRFLFLFSSIAANLHCFS